MTFLQGFILFCAAILGGTLNSVAGGGSFITLPSLIFVGIPPINANATSTVAIWPGSVAGMGAYRKELAKQRRLVVILLSITSLIGGVLGAELLLSTSQATFVKLLPYLLLIATVLFALSGPITARMHRKTTLQNRLPWLTLAGISVLQLIIAIYGGYFGGGIGILMLASLGLMGMENIHEMNAMKTLLATLINGVAVIIFILRGVVAWPQTIVMVVGAIIGGYAGAYYARKIDQRWIRGFVILVGVGMTIYFFVRG
ncbi:MAG TPA: hypothetical protein DDW33_15520 [Ktedonobacter sp.]|jgi:uncharacterized membrane protein YfcA|nr:hypothetical protein [Ktedonobacter sp.]HAT46408.1 hypothetical protein [Ktedonobacter sp.]HBE27082.1 hypothetical protein [Ktedonobacter sp.]HCF84235.1 hypothetical protein [Ktedonobacter sp.]HCJ34379.1 hypothetical protein [Ktedonobacter sp.]